MQKESRDKVLAASNKYLHGYVVELAKVHLESYPKDAIVWIEFARALSLLSRYDEAETAFDNAFAYALEILREIIFTERVFMYQRQGNYLEAEKWCRKALEANPDYAGYYVLLGVVLFRRGDLVLAEHVLRQGILCTGECVDESYLNLGGVLVAQARYEAAAECYQKAIELDPEYKLAKLRLRDVKKIIKIKPKS